MKCFYFSNGEQREGPNNARKTTSTQSSITNSISRDIRRSGSVFNSQNVSDVSANSIRRSPLPSFSQRPNNLRRFTFSELKYATRNFDRSLMIGEGGFGCVYRGTIKDTEVPSNKIEVAIKQLNRKGLQGHKEWLTEVYVLGVVEHPNLVKLVGYCAEDDERGIQRLLVYEYMPNGSLEDHLSTRMDVPLPWGRRLSIALDTARGMTYLHEGMDFQIIFRDLKSSNILLDEQWNAKLSDFGLAREGPTEGFTHISTAVVGTIGYAAPEYILTGRLTAESDIWSYGVFLYELITGRRPLDRNRPKSEQKLLDWVKPYISDAKKFQTIIDPRLEGHCSLKSVMRLTAVANRCLVRQRKSRPKMSDVLEMVQRLVETTGTGSPQISLSGNTLEEDSLAEKKKKVFNLKRRIGDSKMVEGRRMVWWGCKPKLIRTH